MTRLLERKIHFSPSMTRLAIRQLHDADDRVRISSARYLSLLCTPKNRHYMTDPQLRDEVVRALDEAAADSNTIVHDAARKALSLIRH